MSLSLNIEGIILLLFFIAPGFVFTRTYTAYRPRYFREPSAFEQSVLAVIGSTIINSFILAITAIIVLIMWAFTGQFLSSSYIPDFSAPVSNYPLPDLALTAFFGVIYLSASLVSARRFGTFLGRGTATDRLHQRHRHGSRLERQHVQLVQAPPSRELLVEVVGLPAKRNVSKAEARTLYVVVEEKRFDLWGREIT